MEKQLKGRPGKRRAVWLQRQETRSAQIFDPLLSILSLRLAHFRSLFYPVLHVLIAPPCPASRSMHGALPLVSLYLYIVRTRHLYRTNTYNSILAIFQNKRTSFGVCPLTAAALSLLQARSTPRAAAHLSLRRIQDTTLSCSCLCCSLRARLSFCISCAAFSCDPSPLRLKTLTSHQYGEHVQR